MAGNKQVSDVEIALTILQQVNQPMYFRDLIRKVLEAKSSPVHSLAQAMSEIHTQINLDSRFSYLGKGMWGLNEWTPRNGAGEAQEPVAVPTTLDLRRAKLLAEIQQHEVAAAVERDE